MVKDLPASAGDIKDLGLIPGSGRSPGSGGRSPGGGHGNPLQCFCLENSMLRVAWWATVHGVTESDTAEHLSAHWQAGVCSIRSPGTRVHSAQPSPLPLAGWSLQHPFTGNTGPLCTALPSSTGRLEFPASVHWEHGSPSHSPPLFHWQAGVSSIRSLGTRVHSAQPSPVPGGAGACSGDVPSPRLRPMPPASLIPTPQPPNTRPPLSGF